ncbi:MAG: PAS domain-containing hybrid sensor histidine kinase/response regulator [Gemmatimonadales bacterium]
MLFWLLLLLIMAILCAGLGAALYGARVRAHRAAAQLRDHLALAPLAVIEWGPEWRIVRWEGEAARIFGYPAADVLGRRLADTGLVHPDDVAAVAEVGAELTRGRRRIVVSRNRNVTRDGRTIHCVWHNSVALDGDGNVASMLSFVVDVTAQHEREAEQQAAAAALAESERRYRSLAEAGPGFVWATDAAGRPTYVNPAWEAYTGAVLADAQAGGWDRFHHPDDLQRLADASARAADTGTPFDGEFRYRRHDGVYHWFLSHAVPVRDASGRVSAWIGTSIDIDERKAQDERVRWQAGLLNATYDAVVAWAPDRSIVFWNQGAERLYGWRAAEAEGCNIQHLLRTRGGDGSSMADVLRALHREGRWTGELRQWTRNGREVTVAARLVLLPRAGAEPLVLEANRDVTEQRLAEEQLRRAQRLEAIGRLAGGVAHETNNQMSVVLGFASYVARGDNLTPQQRGDLDEICRASERVATLTRQLLAFSRQQVLKTEVLDLVAEVRAAAALLGRLLGPGIRLVVETPPSPLWIRADRTQFSQLLVNCGVNARDAMPDGGTLTIAAAPVATMRRGRLGVGFTDRGIALLTIRDTGAGIAPDIAERIFEPFFTTKRVGEGTGLGLSVVEGIVAQSGGDLWVETAVGRGTCFSFGFPGEPEPAASPGLPAVVAKAPRGEGTILVVEDEVSVRAMMVRALTEAGYTALLAEHGTAALETLRTTNGAVLLVIADYSMPVMDGAGLAEALAERWPALPLLIVSGHPAEVVAGRRAPAIAASFLQKPFLPETLLRRVRELTTPGRSS